MAGTKKSSTKVTKGSYYSLAKGTKAINRPKKQELLTIEKTELLTNRG